MRVEYKKQKKMCDEIRRLNREAKENNKTIEIIWLENWEAKQYYAELKKMQIHPDFITLEEFLESLKGDNKPSWYGIKLGLKGHVCFKKSYGIQWD